MKAIIHVNQHNIKYNNKTPEDRKPMLTCKTYKDNRYGFTAFIKDPEGNIVGVFKYRPDEPLSCGAKVWFETKLQVEVE
jgi:hypothetical protein